MMFLAGRHPRCRPLSSALGRCPRHASGQSEVRDTCDSGSVIRYRASRIYGCSFMVLLGFGILGCKMSIATLTK
jgi:hypothetical protein